MASPETTAFGFGPWVEVSSAALHTRVVIFAAFFVVLTLGLSFFLVFQHLSTYNDPSEQRWLIGVIFMIPIYSVASFVSLWAPEISLECNILGNCYEAFAMYSFSRYLIACLGDEDGAVMQKLEEQDSIGPHKPLFDDDDSGYHFVYHPVPFSWFLDPWQLGRQFYDVVKFGIVQYNSCLYSGLQCNFVHQTTGLCSEVNEATLEAAMILKTASVWLSLFLEQFDLYGEGEFDWDKGYPYITLVLNFSQMWALYCLVQFYHATKKELQAIKPLAKFLTFKAVVFVTWWQGVIIAFIFSSGLALRWFSKKAIFRGHVQSGLQDLLICIEMLIAAVVHIFVYPATQYVQEFHLLGIVAETMVEEDHGRVVARVKESVHDVIFGGGEDVVQDVRITMHQAVEPLEMHITKIRESYIETKEIWGGGSHEKKTVTTEDTYSIVNDDEDSSGPGTGTGTGTVKEMATVETVKSDVEQETPTQSRVTVTTEVSYTPEPVPRASAGSEDHVFIKTTSCRRRQP